MLPPKDQPRAPKKAKKTPRRCQSARPDNNTAARLANTPGSIAPYSWPKFPLIPQPMESDSPTQRKHKRPGPGVLLNGIASVPANRGSEVVEAMSVTRTARSHLLAEPAGEVTGGGV